MTPVPVDTGAQPITSDDEKLLLAVNGEIYNHRALRKSLKDQSAKFKTHSDCEVILHLVSSNKTIRKYRH
jgi:asparagine synthase (glutamine-hydrolysing)